MRRLFPGAVIAIALAIVTPDAGWAVKPGEEFNPNGFLNGPHYNLNIHGKKSEFTCPEQEVDADGNPVYGNSVFIPANGKGARIMMQSGKKGGRAEAITTLQVIDPCSKPFDNDEALVQIPPGEYRVFGRALAKPGGSLTTVPSLEGYEDSNGTYYYYMGTLSSNGYFTSPTQTYTRTKGKSKATEITKLFLWTGLACYLNQADCVDPTTNCTPTTLCCVEDGLGGYTSCGYGGDTCTDVLLDGYCSSYTSTWIFNIAELVDYLWTADNDGLKLLQVRFYPEK